MPGLRSAPHRWGSVRFSGARGGTAATPTGWRADSHRGFCCRSHPCQSDPMDPTDPTRPATSTSTRSAVWPRRRSPTKRRHNASRPHCRPPVDRDQTAKAEAPTTPSPAEAQQLAEHLTWTTVRHRAGHLPEHLRHTFATWLQHGGIPRPGRRPADGHAGDRRTARDGRGGQRDGPPHRHTTLEMRPGKRTPESGATAKDRGHQHSLALRGGLPGRPVVAGSGRSRYCAPGRGSRFASQPAGRACPLPSAPQTVPALVDTSETMEGGTRT
jgi:hypothetical protein